MASCQHIEQKITFRKLSTEKADKVSHSSWRTPDIYQVYINDVPIDRFWEDQKDSFDIFSATESFYRSKPLDYNIGMEISFPGF